MPCGSSSAMKWPARVVKCCKHTFGGLAGLQGDAEGTLWIPYFSVDDVGETDTRAQNSGGSVLTPAPHVPESGRMYWLTAPSEDAFAITRPEPPLADAGEKGHGRARADD